MTTVRRCAAVLSAAGLLVTHSGCSDTGKDAAAADYVLTNGRLYTVDATQPWADALAVEGDMIVYVGDNAGAATFVGEGTKQVDLEGRLMLPGFVESHVHVALGAAFNSGVLIDFADPVDEVVRKVRDFAEAHPERKTIFGATYNAGLFDEKGPNRALLDTAVPDRDRSNVGGFLAPTPLGAAIGVAAVNPGFGYTDNFNLDLAVLNWTQLLFDDRVGFAVGRLAFDGYLDGSPFQSLTRGFLNRVFGLNPTMGITGIGALGAVIKGDLPGGFWLGAQIHDANAVSGELNADVLPATPTEA